MQIWQDLVATAIVGTGKQELSLARDELQPSGTALGAALAALGTGDPETTCLRVAAIVGVWQQAGWRSIKDDQPVTEPCEPDDLPELGGRASQCVGHLLEGHYREVTGECLSAIVAAGKRIREEQLPALMDIGVGGGGSTGGGINAQALRARIALAAGKRGKWLASQNDRWSYFNPAPDDELWLTGSKEQRLDLLVRLRGRDPDKARELLAGSWAEEPAKDRAAFLASFADGLGESDEAFLETTLADRSVEVRRRATDLLVRLPNSRLSREVFDAIAPMLSLKKTLLGKARIEVEFEEPAVEKLGGRFEFEAALSGSARKKLGERGWKLVQLIGAVPAACWVARFNASEDEILRAAVESEWQAAIVDGLSASVCKHSDVAWVTAIVKARVSGHLVDTSLDWGSAFSQIPAIDVDKVIVSVLKSNPQPLGATHPALALLQAHRRGWSPELARSVIASLKQCIVTDKELGTAMQAAYWLNAFGLCIPVELYEEISIDWPRQSPAWTQWGRRIEEFLSLVKFRRDMHAAIGV